ncbi:protein GAMETE EXPRESSED 1-like isoform X1 [Selaginella moellendorffii]|uniref:protein GAMETE EXPRESSED 1-like isoform X1 n=1 Tax=Selaginella moellendorffii TaxID=88036 RepID=UPI000D1C5954|nr:protein GAMETE EXPRESSED 1-like isoform X1 [Selaginella moellendorffii]|eukprot:XP_024516958.1 protein GAMETE EXPRESSED 1-like isoform X1 [Selaginella moellendorffii]
MLGRFLFLAALAFSLFLPPAHSAWWNILSVEPRRPPRQAANVEEQPDQVHNALPLMDHRVPFEMETASVPGSERGGKLLEDLKKKLQSSCWHSAYSSLFSSCREVLKDDSKKMRLAYKFADCFLRSSGKDPLKSCPDSSPVKECTKSLTDHRHHLLLQFFIDIASMCHHLQSEAFKLETEEVIGNLKDSAHWVEDKLAVMQSQARSILDNTDKIFGLQQRLEEEYFVMKRGLVEMHDDLNKGIFHLKEYADETNKHMLAVSSFQRELADHQENMVRQQQLLSENLQEEVSSLRSKAEDINSNVVKSLSGQDELLSGQEAALSGLASLKRIQEKMQEDVLRESKRLHEMHQRLADGSEAILKAQEVFASKQALIFTSLERLFALHNAILTESRTVKAVLFYVPVAILIYLITGTRQTSNGRVVLYAGLCLSFAAEFWSLRLPKSSPYYQHEYLTNALYIRGTYAVAAILYVFYCILTFKDYASLSYKILLDMQKRLDENTSFLGSLYFGSSTSEAQNGDFSLLANVPRFRGYEDEAERSRKDDYSDDPDYDPQEDSDCEELQCTFSRDYNLRRNVRRSGRPLARSAAILSWEDEEMFVSLFRPLSPR